MNRNSAIIEIDLHGLNKEQAKTAIDAALRRAASPRSSVYRIRVIHGYINGTELRTMVRKHYKKDERVKRVEVGMNPGETDLVLREL